MILAPRPGRGIQVTEFKVKGYTSSKSIANLARWCAEHFFCRRADYLLYLWENSNFYHYAGK